MKNHAIGCVAAIRAMLAGAAMLAGVSPASAAVIASLDNATAVSIPIVSGDGDTTVRGPVSFGPGIVYTSTANSLFGYTADYGFTETVLWSGVSMIGLNATRGTMTLTFDTPLSGFLAEINSTRFTTSADAIITAYDTNGRELDRIVLERNGYQATPGYMGFGYGDAAIGRITFANEFIGLRNISVVPFASVAAVPEPATWGLMMAGMGLVGAALRRRRAGPATPARLRRGLRPAG